MSIRKRRTGRLVLAVALLLGMGTLSGPDFTLYAQAGTQDPAMQRARQETQVILDLGRLISFVDRMDAEQQNLRLTTEQARRLARLMGEIKSTARLTPAVAEGLMQEIEDDILTPRQLMHTDRIWAEAERREESAAPRSGSPGGSPGGGARVGQGTPGAGGNSGASASGDPAPGSLASYASGGPYNPLVDTTRPQGEQFEAFHRRLLERIGR
ncbi:MAG: hypothetical protein EA427_06040 [Spirochaetaceae bacterium]|nr:MAG: hypothetical protein EA427_06040 [Spirochaetaceae bacterium]